MIFDFFIVGGDERLTRMANLLTYKNFNVLGYDLHEKILNKKIKQTNSIKFALKNSKNIICSIPFTKDNILLSSNDRKIYIKDFMSYISQKNRLFGGKIPSNILKFCEDKKIFVYDYLKNKQFVVENSISTAEAAIAKAILQNSVNMHSSSCLVLGFGNCGKIICSKLKNFCSEVFVCVDDSMQKTWANAYGYYVFGLDSLRFNIEKFNYVFNTIPKKIFYGEILKNINENASILDITGVGANFLECEEKLINFKYIAGLPGRFKSISSSKILTDVTLKIIKKIQNI